MKRVNSFVMLAMALLLTSGFVMAQSYDYENMEMETYKAELAKWQQREAQASAGAEKEQVMIDSLKALLGDLDKQTADVYDQMYAAMGTDKAGYEAFKNGELKNLLNDVTAFAAMSPEEIYKRQNELDGFEERLAALEKDPRSATTENQNTLQQIRNQISLAKNKMSNIAAGMYTVQRGDYLWKIARKSEVYGDPYAWLRIYESNKDKIKDPNLIYTDQVFSIPRIVGGNEYLVARGETLSSIAAQGNVYGSPFQWMKLYNANKDKIEDPNYILPYQVLQIVR
jgi:nucleoid-associated protein YgaU